MMVVDDGREHEPDEGIEGTASRPTNAHRRCDRHLDEEEVHGRATIRKPENTVSQSSTPTQSSVRKLEKWAAGAFCLGVAALFVPGARAQMIDNTQATNPINAGINKSLSQEIGAGRGSVNTPDC